MREMRPDKRYRASEMGCVVGDYLRWLRNEWGAAERSIDDYESVLSRFALDHSDLTLSDFEPPIGTEQIREFIDAHWGNSATGTRAKVTSIVKSFFRWAFEHDLLEGNPALKVRRPRIRGVQRHAHERERIAAIVAAQPDLRDRVAIELMAFLGLRKNELRLLRWRNIDLDAGELHVQGKGGKPATIPVVYDRLRLDVERLWLLSRAKPADYFLFPSRRGNFKTKPNAIIEQRDRPMYPSTMHRWWAACLRRAEVSHFPMHELRHTAVTEFLRATKGNIALAQLFARHASVRTTVDVYGHLDREDLAEGMKLLARHWEHALGQSGSGE